MRGIETSISPDRKIHIEALYQTYNETQEPFTKIKIKPDNYPLEITTSKWEEMVELSNKDKSHVIFFLEGFDTLPESLRMLLLKTKTFETIRRDILPAFTRLLGNDYHQKVSVNEIIQRLSLQLQ